VVDDDSFTHYVDSNSDEKIFDDEIEGESDDMDRWHASKSEQFDESDKIDPRTEDEEDQGDILFLSRTHETETMTNLNYLLLRHTKTL
jgi:hypothetical protein